jgi:dihydrofolate synthase/folylpolyglutamate synthase
VAVITSISLDHVNVLGHTLAAIAGEKAGIIKPGVPVVSAPQRPEALEVVAATAAECGAPLVLAGRDWLWRILSEDWYGSVDLTAGARGHARITRGAPALQGAHPGGERRRGVAERRCCARAGPKFAGGGARGLVTVEWRAAWRSLREPLWVVVGAHNPYSIGRLLEAWSYSGPRAPAVVFGPARATIPASCSPWRRPMPSGCGRCRRAPQGRAAAETGAVGSEAAARPRRRPPWGRRCRRAGTAATPATWCCHGVAVCVAAGKEAWAAMNGCRCRRRTRGGCTEEPRFAAASSVGGIEGPYCCRRRTRGGVLGRPGSPRPRQRGRQ